jgi:hypothetical protein
MNERIRELWAQAGGNYDGGNQHTWPQYTIDNPEKFAELIVQKCEQVSLKNSHRDDDMGAIIAKQIREHFGVEL